jgi:hypothetical protein
MSLDVEELLLQLLVRVHACRREAQKVEYSREDGSEPGPDHGPRF